MRIARDVILSGYEPEFSVDLRTNPIIIESDYDYYVGLTLLTVPYCFPNIHTTYFNNSFTLHGPDGVSHNIVLPDGLYGFTALNQSIHNAVLNSGYIYEDGDGITTGIKPIAGINERAGDADDIVPIELSYADANGFITIYTSPNGDSNWGITFSNGMNDLLGFETTQVKIDMATIGYVSNKGFTAMSAPKLDRASTYSIECDIMSAKHSYDTTGKPGKSLFRFSPQVQPLSVITHNIDNPRLKPIHVSDHISEVNCKLIQADGEKVASTLGERITVELSIQVKKVRNLSKQK